MAFLFRVVVAVADVLSSASGGANVADAAIAEEGWREKERREGIEEAGCSQGVGDECNVAIWKDGCYLLPGH